MELGTTTRHRELLGGLVQLFLTEGFRKFTLADLAEEMRCSKTTLYALGHSKEAVVRNVLVHFFRTATETVERRTDDSADPAARLVAYLRAVADVLRPASPQFFADLAANPDALAVYERNTGVAAKRVAELISAGVETGAFLAVDSAFVADMVTNEMSRIQTGAVYDRTGLSDSEAYDALAALVLKGISR